MTFLRVFVELWIAVILDTWWLAAIAIVLGIFDPGSKPLLVGYLIGVDLMAFYHAVLVILHRGGSDG